MSRLNETIEKRMTMREQWRIVRLQRLKLRDELIEKGLTIKQIRKEREYRALKKEQRRISKFIRHIEKKINKIMKNYTKKNLS